MSIFLTNKNDDSLRFNSESLASLLNLAEEGGWQPTGTIRKYEEDIPERYASLGMDSWNGTYISSDGQIITSNDCNNLADALNVIKNRNPDLGENMRSMIEFFRHGEVRIS